MSHDAVCNLRKFKEKNLFLRGLIPYIGMKSVCVYYNRFKRESGETKYNITKMLKLAFDGLFAFSIVPIRFITLLAIIFILVSIIMIIYIVISYIDNNIVKGWASIVASIYLVGGFIRLSLGLISEYIARIYIETKGRPLYIVDEKFD